MLLRVQITQVLVTSVHHRSGQTGTQHQLAIIQERFALVYLKCQQHRDGTSVSYSSIHSLGQTPWVPDHPRNGWTGTWFRMKSLPTQLSKVWPVWHSHGTRLPHRRLGQQPAPDRQWAVNHQAGATGSLPIQPSGLHVVSTTWRPQVAPMVPGDSSAAVQPHQALQTTALIMETAAAGQSVTMTQHGADMPPGTAVRPAVSVI